MLGLKLEDKYALENAEQNLKIPGIAFAEWGPGDMSLSLGVLGPNPERDPRMQEPELLVPVETDGIASSPQFMDEGRTVLFTYTPRTAADRTDQSQIVAQPVPKGERKVILRGASDAHYLSSGHLIFSSGENILAVPFDPTRLELKGGTVPVIERIRRTALFNQFSISARGSLLYLPRNAGTDPGHSVLALADRNGNIQKLSLPPAPYDQPRVSPADGKTIAFSQQ